MSPVRAQKGVDAGHALPQRPHDARPAREASHPLPAFPSQSAKPAEQVVPQTPAVHDAAALVPPAHMVTQVPQRPGFD